MMYVNRGDTWPLGRQASFLGPSISGAFPKLKSWRLCIYIYSSNHEVCFLFSASNSPDPLVGEFAPGHKFPRAQLSCLVRQDVSGLPARGACGVIANPVSVADWRQVPTYLTQYHGGGNTAATLNR